MPDLHSPRAGGADAEPIRPIDFTPLSRRKKRFSLRLSPVKIAIAASLLLFAGAGWFVLSAKSVFLDVSPLTARIELGGPLALKIGPRYLLRQGEASLRLSAPGYYDETTAITVGEAAAQTFAFELIPLPGFLTMDTGAVSGARVVIDGEEIGDTPLERVELAAGEHLFRVAKPRYQILEGAVIVEGRGTEQELSLELLPDWAQISIATSPAGASVEVDGEQVGLTPLTAELLAGERELVVKLAAHKAWTETLSVVAGEDQSLPLIELAAADGLALLLSSPSRANVTLNGIFQGRTPLEIAIPPGVDHELRFFLNGYQALTRRIRSAADQEREVRVTLEPILSSVEISATPQDAELYVNGEPAGNANQTIELLAASQRLEIRREGYVTYATEFVSRPGLEQKLTVSLKSLEQQRLESIPPLIVSAAGQTLKLLYPSAFVMGASRREAGRQANEALRNVALSRPYYLSLMEVTNAEFALFDSEHSSGVIGGRTLSNGNQPAARVSWEQAARYCNWLSAQDGLEPFYLEENGRIAGSDQDSIGYRLPTEAEWAWAARVDGDPRSLLKFPWGAELPPPANQGNYADLAAAAVLGRVIANYRDGFLGSAPVGSFAPNANGFYDLGGNVAEWVHDYYGATGQLGRGEERDPLGPESGRYHVIRGSSWAHATVTELRLSYRDYNDEPRDDVGFRIARYLE